MIANIKFSIISTCLALVFLVTYINNLEAANLQASPALQTIFNQAEATYIKPYFSDITINSALNKSPETFAVNIGLTMQRQFKYLRSNPAYVSRFEALREEALAFMGQLAMVHNYRHPTDNSDLPAMRLRSAFYAGLNGELNAMLINKYGLDPANVRLPFMLSQVPPPKNTGGGVIEHGGLHVKKKNEINLFGQIAPPAESDSPFVGKPPHGTQPQVQTQKNNVPTATLTGCSSAKFTIKRDWSTMAAGMSVYLDIKLNFNKTATIFPHITKVVVTYNNRLKQEMGKTGGPYSSGNEWYDRLDLPGYSPKKQGPLKVTFEAYNDQGEVICRGKTQYK